MTEKEGDSVNDDSTYPTANVRTADRIANAPLPTRKTLRMRQNLLVQSWRFACLNFKMLRIIFRGHS